MTNRYVMLRVARCPKPSMPPLSPRRPERQGKSAGVNTLERAPHIDLCTGLHGFPHYISPAQLLTARLPDTEDRSGVQFSLLRDEAVLFQQESRLGSRAEHGVVLPAHRGPSVARPAIALGICRNGICWGGGGTARIIFLVGWSDRDDQGYVRAVAAIAGAVSRERVRQALLQAQTPGEALAVLHLAVDDAARAPGG